MDNIETLRFLSPEVAWELAEREGTPLYVYSEGLLREAAKAVASFPAPYGLTPRYAMKANPHPRVLEIFLAEGLCVDASSAWEAEHAIKEGVPAERISLSSQEPGQQAADLIRQGVRFHACSLRQLTLYGEGFPGTEVGVRLNPGLGTGSTNRTNTGGPASSFGIWHEYLPQVREIAAKHDLRIRKVHTHIGSGGDPEIWTRVAEMTLALVARIPEVDTVNLGGGFKVARMRGDSETDLNVVGAAVRQALERFAHEHGRELHLEIEPGTFLTANAGCLLTTVQDIVSTGAEGYTFLKLDCGMNDILRPSLYGAQHPIVVVPRDARSEVSLYVVAGHCCESGDILTPAPGDPEALAPRPLICAEVGDLAVIEGAGAYCATMSAKGYNSFPVTREVFVP